MAYLGARLTMMRLLAGVHSLVNSKGRSLDELLVALGIVTDMRSDSCMDTFCVQACVRKVAP
jgi:hypothetical protein